MKEIKILMTTREGFSAMRSGSTSFPTKLVTVEAENEEEAKVKARENAKANNDAFESVAWVW